MATKTTTQPASQGMSEDTKSIITVLLLIFVYPIGLIFMWFWTRWPRWVKIILSLPIILAIIGIVAAIFLIALNPSKQIMRANCVKACEAAVDKNTCVQQCISASQSR